MVDTTEKLENPDEVRTQVSLTPEAHRKLKIMAAISGKTMGEIVSDLCIDHLPVGLLTMEAE